MNTHTPGPWIAKPYKEWTTDSCAMHLIESASGEQIAETFGAEADVTGNANAALIAKAPLAPKLAEALRVLYEKYVVDLHGERTCDCDTHVPTCAPCLARAALAEWDAQ